MILKNNRAPLLYGYVELWTSFQSNQWIQIVIVRKRTIRVKIFWFFCPVSPWYLTDDLGKNRAPLLTNFKLCASFRSHEWIQTGVTIRKRPIWVKIDDVFLAVWPCNLTDDLEKKNRPPLLSNIKLCASSHHHMWIQTGFTVRKRLSWVLTSVTLTFDLDLLHGHHFCYW